ncbi:nucleotide sugar dehydrogenase [Candidatus Neomarinimicrobiota bacterium]
MKLQDQLLSKVKTRNFIVGIIGLGYVGLPILRAFSTAGFRTVGYDIDMDKVNSLREGITYIKHITSKSIKQLLEAGRTSFTTDISQLANCDGIIIAVPTPLTIYREPDLKYLVSTAEDLSKVLRKSQIIILESTTYPGTTEEILIPILNKSGLQLEKDYFVAYSPEREDPNNRNYSIESIPKVIGAPSEASLKVAENLYHQIVSQTVPVSSLAIAEMTKLLENIFRSVNIALVNELKVALMRMNIDIWEVIEAASTKPFGFMPFYPGPGFGGHCIPIDPYYLSWKAREYGVNTKFIELAGEINTAMPRYVATRATEVLNIYGKPLKNSKVLMLGLAYKPNIDDDRESPGYYIMDLFEERGAIVSYNDPHISTIKPTRSFARYAGRKSVIISSEFDLIVIVTDHDEYRDIDFKQFNIPILDTRNILKGKSDLFHKA